MGRDTRVREGAANTTGRSRWRSVALPAAVLVVLLLASVAGAVVLLLYRSPPVRAPGAGRSASEPTAADATPTVPGDVVEAYYRAVMLGDYPAARALLTRRALSAFDPAAMASQDRELTAWEKRSESVRDGRAEVVVEEAHVDSGGRTFSALVSMTLVSAEGRWRIDSIRVGPSEPRSSGEGGEPGEPSEGATRPPSGTASEEKSVEVVGEFLFALQEGRTEQAWRYTTERFRRDNPRYARSTAGAFADFEVTGAEGGSGTWDVSVREMWDSGPKDAVYRVVTTPAGPRIDSYSR